MINLRKFLLLLGDALLLYFSLFLALFLRFFKNFSFSFFVSHLLPFSILYFFWLVILYAFGFYDLYLIKDKISFYSRFLGVILINLVAGVIFFYSITLFGITPKTNLVLVAVIFGILFMVWRNFFYLLFSSYFLNKVAIIGQGEEIENLKKEIRERPYLGYKLVPVNLKEELLPQIEKENIDTIIFTEDFESDPKFLKALYFCLPAKVTFLDFVKAYELITEKIPISMVSKAWFLENLKEREKNFYDKIKRIIDLFLAILFLILSFLLWPIIALAIKLEDSGPIFYTQERVGKDRKKFILYKFRSMIAGAEKGGPRWAEKEDQRITKVGKFLRETHLDEIPQMINVIKGNLSLVGPRPERPEFVEKLEKEIDHYSLRYLIKPGFTGWAQIKFRYSRSIKDSYEKFQYDLYYIKNRSFLLDVGILLKTFQLFFKRE